MPTFSYLFSPLEVSPAHTHLCARTHRHSWNLAAWKTLELLYPSIPHTLGNQGSVNALQKAVKNVSALVLCCAECMIILNHVSKIQLGMDKAKTEDNNAMKREVRKWLIDEFPEAAKSIDKLPKESLGYRHPLTARLISPPGYDVENPG